MSFCLCSFHNLGDVYMYAKFEKGTFPIEVSRFPSFNFWSLIGHSLLRHQLRLHSHLSIYRWSLQMRTFTSLSLSAQSIPRCSTLFNNFYSFLVFKYSWFIFIVIIWYWKVLFYSLFWKCSFYRYKNIIIMKYVSRRI